MNAPNKKPTMMQVKNAISNLISEMAYLKEHVSKIDNIFSDYIMYRKQGDNFKAYLEKKYTPKEEDKK
jgi:SLT domain-containing protein|tara:strand:+ start:980 stop:1183 length:204 start_codon:yes stop_codon:yes gene_type:complete